MATPTEHAARFAAIRKLADAATIELTVAADDAPVRGNALASGDAALDRATEDEIIARLDAGDVWAWARVTVTATVTLPDGSTLTGSDTLGACSYASEDDFRKSGDYFDAMVIDARHDLVGVIDAAMTHAEVLIARAALESPASNPAPEPDADPVPDFEEIMRMARRWHFTEVRSIATEAIRELADHERRDGVLDEDDRREWLTTWIDETTDGHSHVIYTAQAAMLLAASDNEDAYQDDASEETPDVSTRACYALRADVWQLIEACEDEWNPDPPDENEDEDAATADA